MRYLIVGAALLGGLLLPVRHVFACSGLVPTIEDFAESAEIVVVGTLTNPQEGIITLQIEEYLKGDLADPELTINNHFIGNDNSCRMSLGRGGRFVEGTRVLAFLQPDELDSGAGWRPVGIGGRAIFRIDGDRLVSPESDEEVGSFQHARESIFTLAGPARTPGPGADPAMPAESGVTVTAPHEGAGVAIAVPAPGAPPVAIKPLPAPDQPPIRGDATAAPAAGSAFPLPNIILGILTVLSALLALWALIQIVQRKPLR